MKFLTTEYRGYVGSIEHSKEDGVFFGSIQFITDMVSYESEDLNDLETAFHNAVDEYIADCLSINRPPNKPTRQEKFVDWHPYPKEKPKDDGYYIVTINPFLNSYPVVTDFWKSMTACDKDFSKTETVSFWERFGDQVIAWAELPEPYQQETCLRSLNNSNHPKLA